MFVIVDFDLVTAAITGYFWDGTLDFNADLNKARTYNTRDEVRYELGRLLAATPSREFRYREVTRNLTLVA
jgi:hypothetical protein